MNQIFYLFSVTAAYFVLTDFLIVKNLNNLKKYCFKKNDYEIFDAKLINKKL
jgi:hypothetical protein